MKSKLLLLAVVLLSFKAYSQSKNSISFLYSAAGNTMYAGSIKSDGGYDNGNTNVFGLSYTRKLNRLFELETGITYSFNNVSGHSFQPPMPTTTYQENYKIITVPLMARYNFIKYAFFNGGFLADIQTSGTANRSQSGIGFELGVGGKYSFKQVSLIINPMIQQHSLIGGSRYSLLNAGVRFGLGYNF